MKYFLSLILLLASFGVSAEIVELPVCEVNGKTAKYYVDYSPLMIAESGLFYNGNLYIKYNPRWFIGRPKEWQLQVFLHECGHLHLHAGKAPLAYGGFHEEYEADNYSIDRLKNDYSYGKKEFDIIIHTMANTISYARVANFVEYLNKN